MIIQQTGGVRAGVASAAAGGNVVQPALIHNVPRFRESFVEARQILSQQGEELLSAVYGGYEVGIVSDVCVIDIIIVFPGHGLYRVTEALGVFLGVVAVIDTLIGIIYIVVISGLPGDLVPEGNELDVKRGEELRELAVELVEDLQISGVIPTGQRCSGKTAELIKIPCLAEILILYLGIGGIG